MKLDINTRTGYYAESSNEDEILINGQPIQEVSFSDKWDDLSAVLEEGSGNSTLTFEEYRNTGFFMRFFRHNQDDVIFMKYQMPHSWDPTTPIRAHMHCVPMASGSGNVKMNFIYTWCPLGQIIPDGTGWTTGSINFSLTPEHQFKHIVVYRGLVEPPANAHESMLLLTKFERLGTDPQDTYNTNKVGGTTQANLAVLFFDVHFKKIKAGTANESPEISGDGAIVAA